MIGRVCREDGLFPEVDPLLRELQQLPNCHPFEKHLPGQLGPVQKLPKGSWASGNVPAKHGFDLRLFYQVTAGLCVHSGVAADSVVGCLF